MFGRVVNLRDELALRVGEPPGVGVGQPHVFEHGRLGPVEIPRAEIFLPGHGERPKIPHPKDSAHKEGWQNKVYCYLLTNLQ